MNSASFAEPITLTPTRPSKEESHEACQPSPRFMIPAAAGVVIAQTAQDIATAAVFDRALISNLLIFAGASFLSGRRLRRPPDPPSAHYGRDHETPLEAPRFRHLPKGDLERFGETTSELILSLLFVLCPA